MGNGLDVCLTEAPRGASLEERLEPDFVACLVRQAGLVVAGHKPAALFSFSARDAGADARTAGRVPAAVGRLLSVYAPQLADCGVRLAWLARRDRGAMVLAWRPDAVRGLVSDEKVCEFLATRGLCTQTPERLMAGIVSRLRSYYARRAEFPHEIGLVLGYPLEDVQGFMADGGRGAHACGYWKVYGDVTAARLRFDELAHHERRLNRLYSEGVPVRELARMGMHH